MCRMEETKRALAAVGRSLARVAHLARTDLKTDWPNLLCALSDCTRDKEEYRRGMARNFKRARQAASGGVCGDAGLKDHHYY